MNQGIQKSIWLLLAREGGRWTIKEIAEALPSLPSENLHGAMRDMNKSKQVARYRGERISYGVTPACTVPRDTTLAELAATNAIPMVV